MSSSEPIEDKSGKEPKEPWYQEVDGFRIPGWYSADIFRSALAYQPRSDDLFIVTFPKCGTTWVQHIVAYLFREGKPFTSATEISSQTPFLEMAGAEAAVNMKRPGAIKTHLPFHLAPWSPAAKYIFVARNPKDCCVSFYHYTVNGPEYCFEGRGFDDFFELFIDGKTDFGDYFDTLLSWYDHVNDPNVLFVTYEQLKKDTRSYVLKIAEFIDPKYRETLEKNEPILQDVIHHSSFGFMKENLNKYLMQMNEIPPEEIESNPDIPEGISHPWKSKDKISKDDNTSPSYGTIRKGIIGDWRNHFSSSQNARMEKKFLERTAGTDIPDLWKDDMWC